MDFKASGVVFDPFRDYPRGPPMRFQPQNVTLLHFINIHANFQLPISITVDFISDGCHRPILDP